MASQGVAFDPWQNIVNVGWNAGPFLWLTVAFETTVLGFGVALDDPTIEDYDFGSSNSYGFGAGWPVPAVGDEENYQKFKTKFVFFANPVNSEGGSNLGAGVYFVNIGLIYKDHSREFIDQNEPPLTMGLYTGFSSDPPSTSDPGAAKVRAYVYKPKSKDVIFPNWQPHGDIGSATTLDQVLDCLDLLGAEKAGKPGDDDAWYVERFYAVPAISSGIDYRWGFWKWLYRSRNDALTYPPIGAVPELTI